MPTQIKVPAVGESIKTVYVADWKKNTGDYCNAGEIICEIETDKASQEIPTEVAGVITTQANIGDELPIGGVLATIDESGEAPAQSSPQPAAKNEPALGQAEQPAPAKTKPLGQAAEVLTTPSAKVHAEELGIDLGTVAGSGKGGRVLKEDVLAAAEEAQATTPDTPIASNDNVGSAPEPPSPVAAPAEVGEVTRKRMSMMRRTIANRLVSAQHEAAMLTTFNEADMSQIIDLRKKCQKEFVETHGVKLGFMSLFVKAVVRALKAVPNVNGAIDGTDIVQYHRQHIGVAISTEKGLVVPVVRDADNLSLAEIEKAIIGYAEKARSGNIDLNDLTGGTFSITNGGVFGSMMSTPILNPPQSGILGMHTIQERPVALNGQVVIRPMMYLALTYDHRIVDGRGAVAFIVRVEEVVDYPARGRVG
ncbi:MAG: 2-oxoglutarate dehydrogenase complex dihydrolipoyllysine-residue succinyltransferase, partial [Verrucomicrobiales bacterium]|nr:2-oxoglutarate dehydrogenase complex dihydrolipoyllysine-residue succinyltransferase [Verrucomicrobiales bacterium]